MHIESGILGNGGQKSKGPGAGGDINQSSPVKGHETRLSTAVPWVIDRGHIHSSNQQQIVGSNDSAGSGKLELFGLWNLGKSIGKIKMGIEFPLYRLTGRETGQEPPPKYKKRVAEFKNNGRGSREGLLYRKRHSFLIS